MQNYEQSSGPFSVSVTCKKLVFGTESLTMPTPTSTDASFCWDDLIFTRTSGASKGLLQKPEGHNLLSLGSNLVPGSPLNSSSANNSNSASQNLPESHARTAQNAFQCNTQCALQGISSRARYPSPSYCGSENITHTLPASALQNFKRNACLYNSSTIYGRNPSETDTVLTKEDKKDSDLEGKCTDTALLSVLNEKFSPNHHFQKTVISRTRKPSLGSMNSEGSSLGNPLNSYNDNSLKPKNRPITDLHALTFPNGFQHTSQRAVQGISSLSAKYTSPFPRGSVNTTHTLPVSALKDFKRNSSLSDFFTYGNFTSSNSIQSSSSLDKEPSQGEHSRIPCPAPRRTIFQGTATAPQHMQLDASVISTLPDSFSRSDEEQFQSKHIAPFPTLRRTILNGTAPAKQPVQLASPVTSSSTQSSSSSDEEPSLSGYIRCPIPAPRRTIKQRTAPTTLPVQLDFLVTSSTHSSSSSGEDLSQDGHSTPCPAPRRTILQGTATAPHHMQLDSSVISTSPDSFSRLDEEQFQSKHIAPFPAPRRTIFQGTATAPHHMQLDSSVISTSPDSFSRSDEEQFQSKHIAPFPTPCRTVFQGTSTATHHVQWNVSVTSTSTHGSCSSDEELSQGQHSSTPFPAPRRKIIQGTASATHNVQLNLSVTSSSTHSSCSSDEESSQGQDSSTPFPASCRKLKPLLLKRSFSLANSANPANPGSDKEEAQPNHRQLVLPCPMHDKPVKHNLANFKQIHETETPGNHDLPNSLNWVNSNSMIGSEDDVIKKRTEVRSQLPNLTHDTISFEHVSIHSDSAQPRTKKIPDFFIVSLRAGAIRISANKECSIQSVIQEIRCHRSQFVIASYPFDPGGQL